MLSNPTESRLDDTHIGQEGIRCPDFICKIGSQCQLVVVVLAERQAFVFPVLVQVERERVILESTQRL